jgi:hypothetical protein
VGSQGCRFIGDIIGDQGHLRKISAVLLHDMFDHRQLDW